ncbi:MAG: hypothetical protein ACI8PT_001230 [Gammaproteobacteria bacterium]|jgi:hypothetical protein
MKKLLFQFDTDATPSVFDTVIGHDGGADAVIPLPGMTALNCGPSVEGAIFTRAPKTKRFTALFIGGSSVTDGEAVLNAVREQFFGKFRVSVMLDSNGCNTTAAASVALLAKTRPLAQCKAVVLAGTGPVGSRAAALLAIEGANVHLTSRSLERSKSTCASIAQRFNVQVHPSATPDSDAIAAALEGADLVLTTGPAGVEVLALDQWQHHPSLSLVADVSTSAPPGIDGLDMVDRDTLRHGKRCFAGIGIGALKLKIHRACIAALFESNDRVLDAEAIYTIAKAHVA